MQTSSLSPALWVDLENIDEHLSWLWILPVFNEFFLVVRFMWRLFFLLRFSFWSLFNFKTIFSPRILLSCMSNACLEYFGFVLFDLSISEISNRGRYSISNINQQLTTCQQMLKFGALISFFFCNIVKNLVHLFSKVPQKVNFLKKKFKSKFFIFLVNIDVGLRWAKILYLSMSTSTNCNF